MTSKPKFVIYLDVDGVLLQFPPRRTVEWWKEHAIQGCVAAPGAAEFIRWATHYCDVRWLTCWCTGGELRQEPLHRLAAGLHMEVEDLRLVHNPMSWYNDKPTGINWKEHEAGVPWVWIDDEAVSQEMDILEQHHARNNFLQTDTSKDPFALMRTWKILKQRVDNYEWERIKHQIENYYD